MSARTKESFERYLKSRRGLLSFMERKYATEHAPLLKRKIEVLREFIAKLEAEGDTTGSPRYDDGAKPGALARELTKDRKARSFSFQDRPSNAKPDQSARRVAQSETDIESKMARLRAQRINKQQIERG